jgi:glycosyltransferase involved in cell wall biosynthesis
MSDQAMAEATPTPIAFCITDLDAGGAETALWEIVSRLDRSQWSPQLYCLGPRGELADRFEAANIPVHCLGATSWRSAGAILRLARLLRAQKPALLQTFLFHANIAGRIAARMAGIRVVISGIRVSERQRRSHLRLERLTRGLVTHHVAVSESVAKFSVEQLRLSSESISVIPNGVDFDRFADAAPADLTQFGIPAGSTTLLFVGRLHEQKGVDVLLHAAKPLLQEDPNRRLLIVGDGPLAADLRQLAESLAISPQIHWAGRRNDVPQLMKSASALVLPSLWEGMPNVVLEAMSSGLPVVATRIDGSADLIDDDVTGWLAEPGSVGSLTSALARCLSASNDHRTRIAATAQTIVQSNFTWDHTSSIFSTLYSRLLGFRRSV